MLRRKRLVDHGAAWRAPKITGREDAAADQAHAGGLEVALADATPLSSAHAGTAGHRGPLGKANAHEVRSALEGPIVLDRGAAHARDRLDGRQHQGG